MKLRIPPKITPLKIHPKLTLPTMTTTSNMKTQQIKTMDTLFIKLFDSITNGKDTMNYNKNLLNYITPLLLKSS